MNTQMIICMVIFAATLVSYMLNKIPMWLTALISMAALYITGCIDDAGALSGFSNVNTLLMACMFIVAAGFRRVSSLFFRARCGARPWSSSALSFTHRQSRSCGAVWAF